jgi:hypothetical protein
MVSLNNVSEQYLAGSIGVVPNKKVKNRKYFVVLKDIPVQLSDGSEIVIEKGFRFDGSSTPWYIEWFLPRFGAHLFSACIHDWLYIKDYRREKTSTRKARKFADKEMRLWAYACGQSRIDNELRYLGVRMFGYFVYVR